MSEPKATTKGRGGAASDEVVFGDKSGFHITVSSDPFGEAGYSIMMWKRNQGTAGFPLIRDYDKAIKIAAFLYENLAPEWEVQARAQEELSNRLMAELEARPKPKPPRVKKNAPRIPVLVCPDCDALVPEDEVSDERVYECQQCGTKGTGEEGRRCESCSKFASKISDTSCPECGGAMDDAEKAEAQRATDGTLVRCAAPATGA
ncbi:MAG TPA: hypothetical protein VGB98_25780 [Pyrinomonadaceae bacterium]|jgi:hypothetical protein